MQVRRQLTSDHTDMLGASVAETALLLQSVRHEIIRCERRIADKLIGEETRELEQDSLYVLKGLQYNLSLLFKDRPIAD